MPVGHSKHSWAGSDSRAGGASWATEPGCSFDLDGPARLSPACADSDAATWLVTSPLLGDLTRYLMRQDRVGQVTVTRQVLPGWQLENTK